MTAWTKEREAKVRATLAAFLAVMGPSQDPADPMTCLADALAALTDERARREAAELERDEAQRELGYLRTMYECAVCSHNRMRAEQVEAERDEARAEVEAAEVRGARWALDAAERAVHVEVPALDPAEVCRARRGR